MKSKSFIEYTSLPKIDNRWKTNKLSPEKNLKFINPSKRPRAYSEINREFEIQRCNKILLGNLIHIANRKRNYAEIEIPYMRHLSNKCKVEKRNLTEKLLRVRRSYKGGVKRRIIENQSAIGGWKRRDFVRENMKSKLPSLVSKRVLGIVDYNLKEVKKEQLKAETEFTLEDDSSVEDVCQE